MAGTNMHKNQAKKQRNKETKKQTNGSNNKSGVHSLANKTKRTLWWSAKVPTRSPAVERAMPAMG
jgi:hypothetical protein